MTTKNSDLVANFEASPHVFSDAQNLHGVIRIASGNIALDIVMLAPIPTNANIISLRIGSDALGGSCTYNVGAYTSAGVVVDEDCFASAVADEAALTELRYEAADLKTTGQKLHIIAGAAASDTTDPGGYYYVAATFAATGGTLGDMAFVIEYVVN
mgnify:CR=1 FL=1